MKAWIAAAVAFLLFVAFAPLRSRDGRSFQIDEALTISESHFLRLFATGQFHSAEWFANVIDRTNMAGGKYMFGMAILVQGLPLPPAPSLAVHSPGGDPPAVFPRDVSSRYAQYLTPLRRSTRIAAAVVAAILVLFAVRMHGWVAAVAALLFFTFHDLTLGVAGIVTRDALMAAAVTVAAIPVLALWRAPNGRRWILHAIGAGLLCGIAISIRLNGALALAFALAALLVRGWWRGATIVAVVAVSTVIAINPYYWADAPPGVPDEFRVEEAFPLRVVHRFESQLRDLRKIIRLLPPGIEMNSPLRRLQFFGAGMVNGIVGFALWISVSLAVLLPMMRRTTTDAVRFAWLWALMIGAVTALFQPVAWQRYLMTALPPLALLAGIGIGELAGLLKAARRHNV